MIRAALLLAGALLAGCAPMRDRVVLLPGADGRTGALVVKTARSETVLASPYASVDVARGRTAMAADGEGAAAEPAQATAPAALSADEVSSRYATLLAAQPRPPRTYIVYFGIGKVEPSANSDALLDEVKAATSAAPAADVVVTGHTDRVGREEMNDRLSLRRAEAVRDALVAIGIGPSAIQVIARGERDWAVPTKDQVAEWRNRRVEVKVR